MRKVWDVVRIEATRRNDEARGSPASVPREAAIGWTIQDTREMCATRLCCSRVPKEARGERRGGGEGCQRHKRTRARSVRLTAACMAHL